MITTRESLNYQFSLIFGYSSPNDMVSGDVIGPGRLTRENINDLSKEVVKFLSMYNAILRDYAGAEVFSIEFELHNFDETSVKTQIFPKSMVLIPGNFKECESLLLALKPEIGYMDVHSSRNAMNRISQLFYEVEEFADHSSLSDVNKQEFYNKFATRFSKKLFGDLIEDKWNKKLIGVSTSIPTEEEMLSTYAKIISNVEIFWHKKPIEINLFNSKFSKVRLPFDDNQAFKHLKFAISEPSANFIIGKTLNLGTSLFNLANIGTLDEFQDNIIKFLLARFSKEYKASRELITGEFFINTFYKVLLTLERYLNKYLEFSKSFLTTGEKGDLSELTENFKLYLLKQGNLESEDFEEIAEIAIRFIHHSAIAKEDLRVLELSSVFNYFSELLKKSLGIIRNSIPHYISRRRLKILTKELFDNLIEKFKREQKPAKILGSKLIEKFKEEILNQIEINSLVLPIGYQYNEEKLIDKFNELIKGRLEIFFNTVSLRIEDLVLFTESQMGHDANIIKTHIKKFTKFSNELKYLLNYILRYSTINRFIKNEIDNVVNDPINFINKFHRFLEKRMGGIKLEWKSYILQWIIDYSKKFLKVEERPQWTVTEIYNDFLDYIEKREVNEQKLEMFLEFLDKYIAKESNFEEKKRLLEFYKLYKLSIGINEEFPIYVKNKIISELDQMDHRVEKLLPVDFLSFNKYETYYDYVKNIYLKYFSRLIPRPLTLILRHNLTNEEKVLFKGELFHVINFKFWHNNVRVELSDNFKEVYRDWMK
ncbi:hypothetical protein LCGC14_0581300 [marine sediment metagenome]|uniref:Uncharacterized protein n=1 Tax=marine sediment metagenome TaxID=412755 RepID=A0A0F9U2J2_9ZZZZ|nr:MAG: hypothetical protein Lokiarch_50760 [Candidatus Lokiarchaeum sp. GC14_75]HEC39830.1 hypothetical protein [bacterium]